MIKFDPILGNTPVPSAIKNPRIEELIIFGKKNLNGRIYIKENIEDVMGDLQEKIERRTLLGELGHPDDYNIHLQNVSHKIDKLWIEDYKGTESLMGEITILETPSGKQLTNLIAGGTPIVFASRGAGTVDSDGVVHLKKIFSFDAIDATHDAFSNARLIPQVPKEETFHDML